MAEALTKKIIIDAENTTNNSNLNGSYWLTRVLYLRSLGFIYCIAFLVALNQNESLIGESGLTPAIRWINDNYSNHLSHSNKHKMDYTHIEHIIIKLFDYWKAPISKQVEVKINLFISHPTLFWFILPTDKNLKLFALSGLIISFFITVLGSANSLLLLFLWLNYFSVVNVGQTWYSFGWESQLLELGFLSIFMVVTIMIIIIVK